MANMANGVLLDSLTTMLEVDNAAGAAITGIVLTNTDSSAVTVTLRALIGGLGAADDKTYILKEYSIGAGETFTYPLSDLKMLFADDDILQGLGSVASKIAFTVFYQYR